MALAGRLYTSLIASVAAVGSAAHAAPPPPIASTFLQTFYSTATVSDMTYDNNGSNVMATLSNVVPGTSATWTTDAATASVSSGASSAETQGAISGGATASALLDYYYQAGGVGGPIPIDISYTLTATGEVSPSGGDVGSGFARIFFYQDYADGSQGDGSQFFVQAGAASPNSADSARVSTTYATEFLPNETYGELTIQTRADAGSGNGFSSTGSATADPYIFIDPAFLAANPTAYLEVSPGVGNLAPVASAAPEPGVWLLLLSGIGGAGLMLRRARDNPTATRASAA